MSTGDVVAITVEAVWLVIKCSAPMLITSLVIGLIISIFQTVTSIQEQTLTFVPKMICVFLSLIICGDWILNNILSFIQDLYSRFGEFVGINDVLYDIDADTGSISASACPCRLFYINCTYFWT